MLNFCPKCGEKLFGDRFCGNCGADLTKYGADNVAVANENANSALDDALNNLMGFAEEAKLFEIEDGVLKKYNGNAEEVTIPDGVTKIGESAFAKCEFIKTVRMPDSVTEIGGMAFSLCKNLSNINLSKNLREIGEKAFSWCSSLRSIDFPLSLYKIGNGAFTYCGLTSLTLPRSITSLIYEKSAEETYSRPALTFAYNYDLTKVTFLSDSIELGEGIFERCTNLEEVTGLGKDSVIGRSAFEDCTSLERINLPYGVTLSDWAFNGSGLKEIAIPDNAVLGGGVFKGCTELEKAVISGVIKAKYESMAVGSDIPQDEPQLPVETFSGCVNLQSVEIKPGIKYVQFQVFDKCKSLEHLTLPNTLKEIHCSLNDCAALKTLVIPDSVDFVYPKALGWYHDTGCGLKEITVGRGVKDLSFLRNCCGNQIEKVTLLGGEELYGMSETYGGKEAEKEYAVFAGYKNLKSVILPNTLKKIGGQCFNSCESLENIIIPESVYEIGDRAFSGCTSLKNIKLSNNLSKIGKGAFDGCISLETIILPERLFKLLPALCGWSQYAQVMGERLFNGCVNLKAVYVPEQFSYIDVSSIGAPPAIRNRRGSCYNLAQHLHINEKILKKYE